jgi:hypothetical protein
VTSGDFFQSVTGDVMPARFGATLNHQRVAMLDMNMLVTTGGRERMEAEFAALFAAVAFGSSAFA